MSLWPQQDHSPVNPHRSLIPCVYCPWCNQVRALQRGTSACRFPERLCVFPPVMMPCRHFLANMQMFEVTLLKPCFADYVFPFFHITPGPLLANLVHHSLTGLLVTLSLSHHSWFKALLIKSDNLSWLLCSGTKQQNPASGGSSSRGHPPSALPETCCHQYPVPAAGGDQLPPPRVRVAHTKEGKEERETMIRPWVLADIQSLDVILPFWRGGRGGIRNVWFAFTSTFGQLIMEANRSGIPNTTYVRLCALARWKSNIFI